MVANSRRVCVDDRRGLRRARPMTGWLPLSPMQPSAARTPNQRPQSRQMGWWSMPAMRLAASQSHPRNRVPPEPRPTAVILNAWHARCWEVKSLPVSALVGFETRGQDPGEGLDFPYPNPIKPALWLSADLGADVSTSVAQGFRSTYGRAAPLPAPIPPWASRAERGAAVQPARRACEAQRAEGNRLLRSPPKPLRGNLPKHDRSGARGALKPWQLTRCAFGAA